MKFQSTLSMRRATPCHAPVGHMPCISIHALHEESDNSTVAVPFSLTLISIHALHEESDGRPSGCSPHPWISIHALHEESDSIA